MATWDKVTIKGVESTLKSKKKQDEKEKKLAEGRARYNAVQDEEKKKQKEKQKEKGKKLAEGRARYNAAQEKNPSKKITAAQAKEAAQDPTSAGAKAIREKVLEDMKKQKEKREKAAYREAYNAPLAQMSRNSTSWSILGQGKDAAKKAKWPEKAVGKMTAKQDALHQKNVEIAEPYDIQYDPASGTWRGGDAYGADAGKPVYDAQALPLPGSTASDMVAGARKVQEMAALPLPNHAAMTAEQKKIYNRVRGARIAGELSGGVEKFAGLFPGRLGSGVESVGKNLVGGALGFGETLDQMIANEKTNFHNEEIRKLTRELAGANRSLNVRGLPASIRQEKIARIRELQERIEEISAKDSVDMTLPGQVLQAEAAEAAEKTLDGMTGLPRKATEAAMGIGQMVPVIAATAAGGPVAGGIVAGAQAAAGKMYELNARGVPAGESFGRGLVSGGIEALTEKFSLGNLNAIAKSGGSSWIKNMLKQAGIEASEEGASYLMNYIADAAAKDPEAQLSMAELLDQASTGALSGGFMAAAGTGVNRLANIGRKPAKGQSPGGALGGGLAEGTTPERHMETTGENPTRAGTQKKTDVLPLPKAQDTTYAGTQAQGLPLPKAQEAVYAGTGTQGLPLPQTQDAALPKTETGKTAYSLPLPDARQEAALPQMQGLPLPQDSAKAGSNPAATNSQGLPLPTSFPEQAKTQTAQGLPLPTSFPEMGKAKGLPTEISYEAQIDGVFNGRLPEHKNITVGPTPDILKKYGAKSRDMTITQPAVRKIAYPDGYMGGKHNLGISALKNLPKQLENPIAILKSKTQDGSVVILTEWNDTQDNPVIAAIHFDKQGALTLENRIASVYGKRNLEALLGRNNENVLYTKENKSIDQLLSERLQLPSTMADDTLVAYSIAQNEGKNKGNPQVLPTGFPEAAKTQTVGLPLPDVRQEATSIDTNPETHTPEQMRTIEEYISSTDADFKSFVQDVTDGKQAAPYALKNVSDRAAQDIKAITGVDAAGFQTKIEPRMIEHIIARHGQNGAADSSMANIDDIARMQYVIDHYDAILDGGKSGAYREPNPNYPGKTRAAKTVLYVKKVNGSYYVVEAVPDSKKKTAYISSAYMNKGDQPILNAPNGAPGSTSENASLNLPIKIVPQAGVESKASPAKIPDPGILRQKEMEQLAQDQLDALESDSFDVPDAEMRERTAQMAENKTLDDYTLEELDALVSESYVNQNADLRDRDQLEKRFGEKWEGDIRDIREMIEQADEQGAGTVIPPEIAVRLNKVRGAYNKTLGRVLDQAAGKDTRMREFLREKVEMPLASAKGDYAHGVKSMLDSYAENMQKYGIRMGSREDAAVMWYGEGQRVDEAGDTVPYTEADLKRDFPKSWQKIKAADAVNRRIYDDYIDRINEARAIVYPHAEERVKLEIAKLRARSAAYQTQIEALDARITKGMATPEETASRNFLMQEMQSADQMANKKQADLDSGEALRGKRMPKRKDYYHHFQEMAEGFGALRNIMETDADIDPRLVGTSDHTRPNTKWQGAMQERITNRTVQSSIGAMLDYVPAAEFMIHIDPQIARLRGIVRDLVDGTADANQTNANGLIEWLTDYTNDIAGKTNPFDRALQKVFGRKSMKVVEWLNGRAKSNAILGNLNSAIAQWFNLPNGVAIIKNPIDLSKGMADYAMALKDGTEARKKLDQSNFMTERYLDESVDQFDKNLLHKPKQFATWLLTVGDKQASQVIWFSAYEQGVRKGVADPVFYADDITQRAVGGRGIGEVPLTQQSKVTKLLAPFQVEVNNQWQLLKQMVGNKDALGLTLMFLLTFGLNELKEGLTGTRTGMDLIDAGKDAWEELSGDEDASAWDYVQTIGGRLTGEVASNVPYGAQIAGLFISDENQRQKLFGESDPTRFGTGNIGIDALFEPVTKFANGETIDPTELITNFMLPWGGKQISRVKGALEDQGIVPKIRIGRKIAKNGEGQPAHIGMLQYGKQPVPGAYNEEGTKLKFALPTDFGTIAKSAAFGRYSLPTGREYIDSGFQGGLNAKNTAIYERLAQGGTDPQKAYEAIRAVTGTKAPEDGSLTAAQAKREAIMGLDLTPEEKVELNRALVGGDDLVSFQDRDSFNITNTVAARNQPAAFALMREQGMDAAQAKKYAELVDDQGATYTLGKDQKITKTYEDGRQEERLLYTKDGKAARLKKAYETIQADESLTDGQKNGVVRAVVLSKLGKKYAGEYAEEFIGGIGVEQLIDAQAAYDKIYDAVQKDTTIHENNRDEYVRVRFADYLENTGLDFLRRESLWYFQSHGESEFKEPWSEIIRKTTPSDEEERTRKQSALRGLQDSGMDESLFKVIKAGMGRVYADKDANGETIDGSRKRKLIEYLNQYDGLTDEQKNLLMKTDAYKYGMGEKPQKGKSSSRKYPLALPTSFKLPSMKSLLPF